MRVFPRLMSAILGAAVLAAGASLPVLAAEKVEITEWDVPYGASTRPRDPAVAPDGAIWFVGQRGHYLGRLDPATGEFTKIDLADEPGPHNLVVADDGAVWYAGNLKGYIGRLDPKTGEIAKYPMPDEKARDPHTLIFDGSGSIWFTVQGGNFVGHLNTATGEVRLAAVPTARARPYGIDLDREGRPWIALFGTNKIATIEASTMTVREIALPRDDARPRRLIATSDGAIWYGDYAGGMLGRYDPDTGDVVEYPLPGGKGARPYALEVDDDDVVWAVETGPEPNRFVGFDTRARAFLAPQPVPSGGDTVRHMVFDEETGSIWFGSDTGTIGRARLL